MRASRPCPGPQVLLTLIQISTRLLGLAAILGVVTSDVLYYSSTHFKPQISTLVPALLAPLFNVEVPLLEDE